VHINNLLLTFNYNHNKVSVETVRVEFGVIDSQVKFICLGSLKFVT